MLSEAAGCTCSAIICRFHDEPPLNSMKNQPPIHTKQCIVGVPDQSRAVGWWRAHSGPEECCQLHPASSYLKYFLIRVLNGPFLLAVAHGKVLGLGRRVSVEV